MGEKQAQSTCIVQPSVFEDYVHEVRNDYAYIFYEIVLCNPKEQYKSIHQYLV